ncbi:flagellar biosynthesis anti-sigma factor FlgM [candidate division KSB1 bacterium]
MKVNNIGQSVQTQQVQRKGKKTDAAPVKQSSDKVEISSEARELAQSSGLSAKAAAAAKNEPDVRVDKVKEAREKVEQGFYNQENIGSALADRLLKEFGI